MKASHFVELGGLKETHLVELGSLTDLNSKL